MKTADRIGDISIFSDLSKKECNAISKLMTTVDIADGHTLTTQGDLGREFMIITSGTAQVEVDGEVVAQLGPGDFLGELAVISSAPRTATVTATSAMAIEILNRREFIAMLNQSPGAATKILIAAVTRLQENQQSETS